MVIIKTRRTTANLFMQMLGDSEQGWICCVTAPASCHGFNQPQARDTALLRVR